jgi:hypothetical protein
MLPESVGQHEQMAWTSKCLTKSNSTHEIRQAIYLSGSVGTSQQTLLTTPQHA